ncbi:HAD hydrolase-like protein [Aliiroseovarius lamellibrachiae]|uniref:HAD hydrolase-like protein n=1 Tax=Aliiroseovarius lamellibrachiae TaxID=1924933 RepID=UPI001BE09AEF|nr:HAD hydrolase-like protein [Aliiroseovarius lamellibrachiae]MBT2131600.1 HAD hydrolase-like protein [Aliiroseovarius lamellibrachiae]
MGAVYWDLDGTLTDPKKGITESIQFALRELDLPVPPADDLTWCIGPALLWSFERLGAHDPEAALAHYRAVYTTKGLYDCTLYDGILQALGAIGADHPMHLATAKPHSYAKKITAHYGIAPHLTHEFGPELDGTRNDKGELLAHALDITGDDPATSVMVGDRHYDMKAARDVGMRFIAVGWGYGADDDLSSADAHVKTPAELAGAVASLIG